MGDRQPLHWLDYQSDELAVSASAITGATPRLGRNRNAWAAKSGGTNPALVTRNGFNAARFDGTQPMAHVATSGTGYVNCTLIIAGYMISGGTNEDIVFGFGAANPSQSGADRLLYRSPNNGTMGMAGWAIDIGSSGTSWDIAGATPHAFAARKIGQPVSFDRDGSIGASVQSFPSNPPATLNPVISIGGISGSGGSNAYGTNMDFFEVMAWEYELTDREYQMAQAYVCWRYGFPIVATSPFRDRPPMIGD
jgi:hypothetical protein